jgi:hypothetical protein
MKNFLEIMRRHCAANTLYWLQTASSNCRETSTRWLTSTCTTLTPMPPNIWGEKIQPQRTLGDEDRVVDGRRRESCRCRQGLKDEQVARQDDMVGKIDQARVQANAPEHAVDRSPHAAQCRGNPPRRPLPGAAGVTYGAFIRVSSGRIIVSGRAPLRSGIDDRHDRRHTPSTVDPVGRYGAQVAWAPDGATNEGLLDPVAVAWPEDALRSPAL